MNKIIFLPPAAKYLKKLNDKKLKSLFKAEIDKLMIDPYIGEMKSGDLSGIFCCEIRYNKTDYRLAYTLVEIEPDLFAVLVLAGTRENFYNDLKRYMKLNSHESIKKEIGKSENTGSKSDSLVGIVQNTDITLKGAKNERLTKKN